MSIELVSGGDKTHMSESSRSQSRQWSDCCRTSDNEDDWADAWCAEPLTQLRPDCEDTRISDFGVEARTTYVAYTDRMSRSQTWISHNCQPGRESLHDSVSAKRRASLQLPSFKSLGISAIDSTYFIRDQAVPGSQQTQDITRHARSAPPNSLDITLSRVLPPLTPPPEDVSKPLFTSFTHKTRSGSSMSSQSQPEGADQGPTQEQGSANVRMQGIALPDSSEVASSSQLCRLPWLAKASRNMLASLDLTSSAGPAHIHLVSQTLPSQAKDSRSKPTFEEILEILQTESATSPYITITHAVQQARVMEEVPKTPPSTPNLRREVTDYFGNDQSIFTHASVVPIYHSHDRNESTSAGRLAHHIAAPGSIEVGVLERYIPPTMPEEIHDFFTTSNRSYLADRLSELSAQNGSLLLIYPTQAGGRAFTRHYIGPVIDPHLRRFIMLNGLTSDAATRMGSMTAVDHMIDFEEMKGRIAKLCQDLSNRASNRGPSSTFSIARAEVANVVLDRSTWINWYIEQEQSRLRQNLVEYHQAGGRMPEAEGVREITVSMLIRDFVKGMVESKEVAGDADVEVGVFLITRSTL